MKQQKEVNSKAGSLKRKTTISNLFGEISKTASMLLIAVAGFSMMSFTQDDALVNNVDTNLNNKKEAGSAIVASNDACCGTAYAKPGDEIKSAFRVSLPNAKAFVKADNETANRFQSEVNARRFWSMDMVAAVKQADAEINFNFVVSKMSPLATTGFTADAEMVNNFTEDVVLKSMNIAVNNKVSADNEVVNNFIAEHYSVKNVTPAAKFTAKADAEILKSFERANQLYISIPSKVAASNADLEIIQHYQINVKSLEAVATK